MSTTTSSHGKPTDGFRRLGTSLEPATSDLGSSRTPIDRFFVCNAGAAPEMDAAGWRLRVDGAGAATPVSLTVDDLRALPQVELDAWLECAGNGRRLFSMVAGQPIPDDPNHTMWLLGALGMARWSGPRLRDVLALASPDAAVTHVGPVGADRDNIEGEPVRMSPPIDKARHPDTIVALTMNDAPLMAAHGAPARLVVPGWMGAYSVKWLDRLELSHRWVDSFRSNEYYVLRDEAGAITGPATVHPPKSQLRLDWNAELPAGSSTMRGYARSGLAPITAVEWSLDDGPWRTAELGDDLGRWAWRCFEFDVELTPGDHVMRTRATDGSGAVQPLHQTPHRDGVLWNAVIPHPVTATA